MKAITLDMPWDWVMSDLSLGSKLKHIENRPFRPLSVVGQRIALHAGKNYDYDAAELIKRTLGVQTIPERTPGVIVATVVVVGWVEKGSGTTPSSSPMRGLVDIAQASPWFFGPIGWVVTDTMPLERPIPCRGKQGLWNVPPDVERRIQVPA